MQEKYSLNWRHRTQEINSHIDEAYQKCQKREQWGCYNGQSNYGIGGVDDYKIILKTIAEGIIKGQTEFVFMDIGAGDFSWGRNVAQIIKEKEKSYNRDIKVSIYSIRGEINNLKSDNIIGICTLYEFGSFKVENLTEEFKRLGHGDIAGKVDIIVSSWCLRHLVDPTGTLLQAYEHLRLNGKIFFDGFECQTFSDVLNIVVTSEDQEMLTLVTAFNAPFFMQEDKINRRENCFVMQKSNTYPSINMKYLSVIYLDDWHQVGSNYATVFSATEKSEMLPLKIHGESKNYTTNSPAGERLFENMLDCFFVDPNSKFDISSRKARFEQEKKQKQEETKSQQGQNTNINKFRNSRGLIIKTEIIDTEDSIDKIAEDKLQKTFIEKMMSYTSAGSREV